jgi:hypothetical protein
MPPQANNNWGDTQKSKDDIFAWGDEDQPAAAAQPTATQPPATQPSQATTVQPKQVPPWEQRFWEGTKAGPGLRENELTPLPQGRSVAPFGIGLRRLGEQIGGRTYRDIQQGDIAGALGTLVQPAIAVGMVRGSRIGAESPPISPEIISPSRGFAQGPERIWGPEPPLYGPRGPATQPYPRRPGLALTGDVAQRSITPAEPQPQRPSFIGTPPVQRGIIPAEPGPGLRPGSLPPTAPEVIPSQIQIYPQGPDIIGGRTVTLPPGEAARITGGAPGTRGIMRRPIAGQLPAAPVQVQRPITPVAPGPGPRPGTVDQPNIYDIFPSRLETMSREELLQRLGQIRAQNLAEQQPPPEPDLEDQLRQSMPPEGQGPRRRSTNPAYREALERRGQK